MAAPQAFHFHPASFFFLTPQNVLVISTSAPKKNLSINLTG